MEKALLVILKSNKLFEGLTDEQIDCLIGSNSVKISSYKRNEVLFWTDELPEKLYILLNGSVAMAKDTLSGKRSLSKSNVTPGELIGAVRLFSPKKLLWEYAVALENTTVLEIVSGVFIGQGTVEPEIQAILLRNIIGNFIERIDYLGQKVRILSIQSTRIRIANYLLSLQKENEYMVIKSTREEIADYLGIARPSLSRELGRMQDEGIIQIIGKEVFIKNQEAFDKLFD